MGDNGFGGGGDGVCGRVVNPIQDILGVFSGFSALATPNLLSSFKANLNKNHSSRWFLKGRNHQVRLSLNMGPYQVSSANHVISEHYDIDL